MKPQEKVRKPFFAKFLESQAQTPTTQSQLTGPLLDGHVTLKFPSDSDEGV